MITGRPLVLVANPGSTSRKYAIFKGNSELARIHFEWVDTAIHYTITSNGNELHGKSQVTELNEVAATLPFLIRHHQILPHNEKLDAIGLRIVAPGAYFLSDHRVDTAFIAALRTAQEHAPIHVNAALSELTSLMEQFPDLPIYGISDSSFHATKPEFAWNYGISLELADRFDIKRFGYHGLSVASAIKQVPYYPKIIICHLGGGNSVTAVRDNKSLDTTMGYSPLEGPIMATRSGSLDISAANRLKTELQLNDKGLEDYLNTQSGLLGLGGSSDMRKLLEHEKAGDHRAHLALATYIHTLQKAIGQMTAAAHGIDALIFTGTIGERAASVRERIVTGLDYLGLSLDERQNRATVEPQLPTTIHRPSTRPIYVVPVHEEAEIAAHVINMMSE